MNKYYISIFLLFLLGLIIVFPGTIFASEKNLIEQSLEFLEQEDYQQAINTLEKTLSLLRSKAPLELNNLQFTEGEAAGFGIYQSRQNNHFAQGETFLIYAEPKNYTIKEVDQDLYEIHIKEDIFLLNAEGNNEILFGQKDFLDYHLFSHSPNNEIFITNTITQDTPFPPGKYRFLLVIKDVFSQKTVEKMIDFTIE